MALQDYQLKYRGVTIGDGTAIPVEEIEGLEGHEVRTADTNFPRSDGQLPGLHLGGARIFTLKTEVWSTTGSQVFIEAQLDTLFEAFTRSTGTEHEFTFKYPEQYEKMIRARTLKRTRVRSHRSERGTQPVMIAMKATDPRIYSSAQLNGVVTEFDPNIGTNFNFNFPLNHAAGATGDLIIENQGNSRAYPVLRFVNQESTASVTSVTLDNLTTGISVQIDTTVTSGQTLTADFDAYIRGTGGLVVHIGGTTRYGDWVQTREPIYLDPGFNTFRLSVTPTGRDIVGTINWRHTDL